MKINVFVQLSEKVLKRDEKVNQDTLYTNDIDRF